MAPKADRETTQKPFRTTFPKPSVRILTAARSDLTEVYVPVVLIAKRK